MTTVEDLLLNIRPKREPKHNQWGQYVIPERATGTEVAYQRATTLARMMADTYNLDQWQRRMLAIGLTQRPDLYAQIAAATVDERKLLNEVCEQAAEHAGSTIGRNIGSAMHRFAQRADAGEDVHPPPPLDADLTAYRAALAAVEITPVEYMAERIVVVPSIAVAGTFDRILTSPRWSKPRIGDLKTAQEIYDWIAIAIQLAVYAQGDSIWDLDLQSHQPMPDVDRDVAIMMHVPAGSGECKLYEVDIAAGWEAAQLAVEIRGWRKRKDLAAELNPAVSVAAPDDGGLRAEHARQRLVKLADAQASISWPAGVQTFKEVRLSRHIYTHDELLRIEQALSDAEGAIEAEFPPPEPRCDPDLLARMIARLETLPKDLFDGIVVDAQREHIPNLRQSGGISIRHLQILEVLVDAAETETAARTNTARGLLGEYGDDVSLGRTILALAGARDLGTVDEETSVRVTAIVEALDDDLLVVHTAEDGTDSIVPSGKAEDLIVDFGGEGRAVAVKKAAEIAAAHGLTRPRSVAVASSDPLLVALVAHAARQPA